MRRFSLQTFTFLSCFLLFYGLAVGAGTGYSFSSWSGGVTNSNNPSSVTMSSPKSVTANFTPAPVSCTFDTNPSGLQITVDKTRYTTPQSFSWTPGSLHRVSVSYSQKGASGTSYVYASWSDGEARTHTITAPSSSTTYTANFATRCVVDTQPKGRNVEVDGVVYKAPKRFTWPVGSIHTLSISSPQQGGSSGEKYFFSSWGDQGEQTRSIVTPPDDATYKAFFNVQYSLTTSARPSTGGLVSPGDISWYDSGQVVSLTAQPNPGYTFIGWSGGVTGKSNPISVTMNGAKKVVANFKRSGDILPPTCDDRESVLR